MMLMAAELLNVLMRWAHIASAAVILGGFLFARVVALPALDMNPDLMGKLVARYRFLLYAAIAGLLVSGLFNLFTHVGHTPYYHAWFGIKILLALHVFAAAILSVRSGPEGKEALAKRARRMSGVILSALAIILISAYLRRIY